MTHRSLQDLGHFQIRLTLLLVVLSSTIFSQLTACAYTSQIDTPDRTRLRGSLEGQIRVLAQSMYVMDLYDENELYMLSEKEPGNLRHISDRHGNIITPGAPISIIPAGTQVMITDIEFPTLSNLAFGRMLTTPRYNPWLFVIVENVATHLPQRRRTVLVLPADINSAAELKTYIGSLLIQKNEFMTWKKSLTPSIWAAIKNKEVVTGMTPTEVQRAVGLPLASFSSTTGNRQTRIDWMPTHEFWFTDGLLSKTETPARAPELLAQLVEKQEVRVETTLETTAKKESPLALKGNEKEATKIIPTDL